jgi:hypothetical protein
LIPGKVRSFILWCWNWCALNDVNFFCVMSYFCNSYSYWRNGLENVCRHASWSCFALSDFYFWAAKVVSGRYLNVVGRFNGSYLL